ncbi:MAG: NADP-dependent malic enzyme [Alphaproteobacteria bacterium]|nr:NADP-dependent malic enzyme [Alphaproteobacteria bacterium]
MKDAIREAALEYHRSPTPGKISIKATKPMATQRDLALAYSPGVAAPCEEIAADPLKALDYTSRGNLVAVITNGTAVLGLGNIGALASKPVMEGKSVLFKKFANVDSVDIEIDETDIDKFVDIVAALEPSFGGINLEDIKAPECFEIERRLRERMNIPVFHDDQHGTAIIVSAAFLNWLDYSGRDPKNIRLVCSGAGASAVACLNLLVRSGLPKDNIIVCDRKGVIYEGRTEDMDPAKAGYMAKTNARTIAEALEGADVFLGLSAPKAVSKEMVAKMADAPLIMALANPTPEIMPEDAREVKPDAIICTGRSDYPNQVNNVLCFPFIFRGALDVGATAINEEMKLACVKAIAALARREASAEVVNAYHDENLSFGPEYLIPKPLDPRLIVDLPIAVALAAMESGVATRPIEDMDAYRHRLQQYFYRTQLIMRPIFERAKSDPKRVVYCEGEEENILRAVQVVVDEGLAKPVLVGRQRVIESRIEKFGLRMRTGANLEIVDPEDDPRYYDYWTSYQNLMERRGVTPAVARTTLRTNSTVIGALMVHKEQADALICGTVGLYRHHLKDVIDIIGLREGVETPAALRIAMLSKGTIFVCDTHVNADPTALQIEEMTLLAAEEIRRFGIEPKIALLSHSDFGTENTESALKMRAATAFIKKRAPELEIDGEMHADCALSRKTRDLINPNSTLKGDANLLIMPNSDAANISFNMIKMLGDATTIGPLLLGAARPAHILTPSATSRGIVNATALAAVAAQVQEEGGAKT